jgi:uncharacterized protein (DUF3084 family)
VVERSPAVDPSILTRDEAIRQVRLALLRREDDVQQRAVNLEALRQLLDDLEGAEELLDVFYQELVAKAGERKARLDQIVFSRRVTRGAMNGAD